MVRQLTCHKSERSSLGQIFGLLLLAPSTATAIHPTSIRSLSRADWLPIPKDITYVSVGRPSVLLPPKA